MANKKNKFVEDGDHIWKYDTGEAGSTAMVLGGIHGNERAGIKTVEKIVNGDFEIPIVRGKLIVALGNLLAIDQDRRFSKGGTNLNREFFHMPTEAEIAQQRKDKSYEVSRAHTLMPYLRMADAALDLHGFRQREPKAKPFIITEPRGFKTAAAIGAPFISSGWSTIERGGTDSAMEEQGKIGICYELSQLVDIERGVPRAEAGIINFLHTMELVTVVRDRAHENPEYVHATQAVLAKKGFRWTKDEWGDDLKFPLQSWDRLPSGLLIAQNGLNKEDEIRVEKEGQYYIIFPSDDENPAPGDEMFNLGKRIDPNKLPKN